MKTGIGSSRIRSASRPPSRQLSSLSCWAPWEEWAEFDWPFRVPWVYTLSDDIFVRPFPPPSPDTLSWRPDIYDEEDGNIVFETEQPERLDLNDAAAVEAPKPAKPEPNRDFERTPPSAVRAIFG